MVEKVRRKIHWGAISSIATVIIAIGTVVTLWPSDIPVAIINPTALTAKIESFPYRHAGAELSRRKDESRKNWSQPLEYELKVRGVAPELIEAANAAMETIIDERFVFENVIGRSAVSRAEAWYLVAIRNDGDIPLKGVFFKFPVATSWLDESGQLVATPLRIEIGDMDQKSERKFTFWGARFGRPYNKEDVVLGHSNGLGSIEFE